MPNSYARQTALSSVGGRIGYVSSPDKQEMLLACHDGAADMAGGAYWQTLAQECEEASKHATPGRKCVQGRELMMLLANDLLKRMTPEQIATTVAKEFERQFGRPCFVAVHLKKKKEGKDNLHVHIIYAERELLPEPTVKIAPRRLFYDEEGRRCYKKAEVLDAAGELRPGCRIVEKGEEYERRYFGPVDTQFSGKGWLRDCKTNWVLPMQNDVLRGGVEFAQYDASTGKLPQQHIGNAEHANPEKAAEIVAYNEAVKEFNSLVDQGKISQKEVLTAQREVKSASKRNHVLADVVQRLRTLIAGLVKKEAASRPTVAAPAQPEPLPVPSFAALITADAAVERAEKAAAAAKLRVPQERPVDHALLSLPDTLRAAVKQLRQEYYAGADAREQMDKLHRPERPRGLFVTKKQQAQYARAVAAHDAKYEPLRATLYTSRQAVADALAIIMPELHPEERQKQGYGMDAPLIDATNITAGDIRSIEASIEFKLQRAKSIGVAVAAEERYAADLDALTAAREELGSAKEAFDAELRKIPPEHVEAAMEAVEQARAERQQEATADRSAEAEPQRQPQRRSSSHER